MVALRGETRTLNLEVCTVKREESRWNVESISAKITNYLLFCHGNKLRPLTGVVTAGPDQHVSDGRENADDVKCSLV